MSEVLHVLHYNCNYDEHLRLNTTARRQLRRLIGTLLNEPVGFEKYFSKETNLSLKFKVVYVTRHLQRCRVVALCCYISGVN